MPIHYGVDDTEQMWALSGWELLDEFEASPQAQPRSKLDQNPRLRQLPRVRERRIVAVFEVPLAHVSSAGIRPGLRWEGGP
jgi:hypothetical protein